MPSGGTATAPSSWPSPGMSRPRFSGCWAGHAALFSVGATAAVTTALTRCKLSRRLVGPRPWRRAARRVQATRARGPDRCGRRLHAAGPRWPTHPRRRFRRPLLASRRVRPHAPTEPDGAGAASSVPQVRHSGATTVGPAGYLYVSNIQQQHAHKQVAVWFRDEADTDRASRESWNSLTVKRLRSITATDRLTHGEEM